MAAPSPAKEADAQQSSQQEFFGFQCCFPCEEGVQCTHTVKEAWVASCSHLFCFPHAKEWFSRKESCPICREGPVKVVKVDLSQAGAKKRGRMAVVGMTPSQILQASEAALSFWVDQKVFQFEKTSVRHRQLDERHKKTEETIKSRLKAAEAECIKLEAEQEKSKKAVSSTVDENSKVGEEVAGLKHQLEEAEGRLGGLKKRIAGERKKELFTDPLLEGSAHQVRPSEPASRRGAGRISSPGLEAGSFCSFGIPFDGGSARGRARPSSDVFGADVDVGSTRGRVRPDPDMFGADVGTRSDLGLAARSDVGLGVGLGARSKGTPSGMQMPSLTPGFLGQGRMLKKRNIS